MKAFPCSRTQREDNTLIVQEGFEAFFYLLRLMRGFPAEWCQRTKEAAPCPGPVG